MMKSVLATILALTAFASAEKQKTVSLTLTTPTGISGAILQPGNYEVREISTPSGPALRFTRLFRNELASELVQADQGEVVAEVPVTEQPLQAPPRRTALLGPSTATALEVRGLAIAYHFEPSPAAPTTATLCASAAQ